MMRVFCVANLIFFVSFTVGCGVANDFKKANKTIKDVKEQTKARLDELQVRGEMDFELQEAFKVFKRTYEHVWAEEPVKDWSTLMQAQSEVEGAGGFSLDDAKKKGIVPVWNIPTGLEAKVRQMKIIGYAATSDPEKYWALMGDGKFQKMSKVEIDEIIADKQPEK